MKTKKLLLTNILIGLAFALMLIPAVPTKATEPGADPSPSATVSPDPTPDPTPSPEPTPTATPSPEPTPTATPTPEPTPEPTPTYTLTPSATTVSTSGSIDLKVASNVKIPSGLKISMSPAKSDIADCKVTANGTDFKATFTIKKSGKEDFNFNLQDKNGTNLATAVVKVDVSADKHKIEVVADSHGTAKPSATEAAYGTEITLTATPDKGYRLKEWKVEAGDISIKDNKFKMGTKDVKIKPIFEEDKTNIKITTDNNGTAKASATSGAKGTEVTLTATPNAGFKFKEWQVVKGDITIKDNKFKIGDKEIEIKAIFEPVLYKITVTTDGNGIAIADPSAAAMGSTINLAVKANEGYRFKSWQVIKGSVSIKKSKFVLGNTDVEIKATFEKDTPTPSPSPSATASASPSASPSAEIDLSEEEFEVEPDEFRIKFSSIVNEENASGIAFVFTCEECDQKIKIVEMDGQKLTIEHYLLSDDERTVELRESYLESLENGEHEITFTLKDGSIARGSFNLNREEAAKPEKKGPNKVLFFVIIGVAVVLAGAGIAAYFILNRSEED